MELRWDIFLVIVLGALFTCIPRILPLVVLSKFTLPEKVIRWLHHIPVAIIASLIAQEIFLSDGAITPLLENTTLLAAIPTFLVAFLTRSLLTTVIVGILCMMLIRFFL